MPGTSLGCGDRMYARQRKHLSSWSPYCIGMTVNKGTDEHERSRQGAVTTTEEYAGCARETEVYSFVGSNPSTF